MLNKLKSKIKIRHEHKGLEEQQSIRRKPEDIIRI